MKKATRTLWFNLGWTAKVFLACFLFYFMAKVLGKN
jgi:hypothetical protein